MTFLNSKPKIEEGVRFESAKFYLPYYVTGFVITSIHFWQESNLPTRFWNIRTCTDDNLNEQAIAQAHTRAITYPLERGCRKYHSSSTGALAASLLAFSANAASNLAWLFNIVSAGAFLFCAL